MMSKVQSEVNMPVIGGDHLCAMLVLYKYTEERTDSVTK